MENLANKKALIILTNEAYLPKSGRGGRRLSQDGTTSMNNENGPVVPGSPSAWLPSQPTIMDPPTNYSAIQGTETTFGASHQPTGVDVFELGYIWMTLKKQYNMELVFATPRGGPVAADPLSMERIEKDSKLRDNLRDERDFIAKMGHTVPISWVKPEEFKMVILPGGHGAMFDLPEHDDVACTIAEIYKRNGVVAAIGHGVAGLLNVRMERRGDWLIKGKRITCFSKEEERQTGYEKYLPFYLEERVKERGAKTEIKKPFETNVVIDERLITAQNAPSIHEFVSKIIEQIRR
ncbi:hypothetical protein PSACC_02076 [Paramicrosporidium saccamoebae]|uniref:D-lactate dehydratase n=1 Tax=Paramicrosporidium saccamoebae TaxID=1246581 RepID=A0A2H9TK52_9FUNG|nr:hypothetical protein PSACC_02076 [Paramicrosporidium saccamoebae]